MKTELSLAFNEVLEEKQLPKDVIQAAIEGAMIEAYRKAMNASKAQDVQVKLDFDTGDVKVFAEKEVTDVVMDFRTEVLLDEARKIKPDVELGDTLLVESTPENFGRVAAQNARQKIQSMIRQAEKNAQLEFYGKQVNEIVSGVVQAVNARGATIGLDLKAEGIMMRKEMIPGERLKIRDRIRSMIVEVKDDQQGLQILMSRAHRNFLRRLLEIEVPEIFHGVVEIRSIAREPGERAKVSVSATQQGIDPVGACVGKNGVRIQSIVRELHDEKIDVIEWNKDPALYIAKAISPARVTGVYLNSLTEDNKTATVVVPEDQLSLAIGREGQNARLAAKLTGWRIDIMSLTEAAGKTLVKVRSNPEYAEMLVNEAETIAKIEELIQKKAEGRAISPDETMTLTRFVDRIEKRDEADRRAEDAAHQMRLVAVRNSIPPQAFEVPILDVDLKEHLLVILQETGIETLGDLIMRFKMDPDKVLAVNGIGPKAFDEIKDFINAYKVPAEAEEAQVEEVVEVPSAPAEEAEVAAEAASEAVVEEVPAEAQAEAATETPGEEKPAEEEVPFEDLFKVDSMKFDFTAVEETSEEEGNAAGGAKKKKGKKKKGVTVEYDPDKDQATIKRTHKRGEDDWGDW